MKGKVVPEGSFPDGASDVNLTHAEKIYVEKIGGHRVSLSSIFKDQKTVSIFLRKFDCPTCYTYAILFSHLRPILMKADYKIVFFTCHTDLQEIHSFVRNFAYWLRQISPDGLTPLPGELYMDPNRDAYRFFGLRHSLSKRELYFMILSLKIENFLGWFRTSRPDGDKKMSKSRSKHHTFLEIVNYVRDRMPVYIKQSGFGNDSILWQSPGICVVRDNKLVYRYILKEQYKTLPESPKKFLASAFDITVDESESEAFDLKTMMEDFIDVITTKAVTGKLDANELVLGPLIGGGRESQVYKSTWLGTEVAVKYFRYPISEKGDYAIPSAANEECMDGLLAFSNELAILMSLKHKNVITMMGFGAQKPTQFIVMEYMSRGSLFDALGSEELISPIIKSRMIKDILDGLVYIHESSPSIIHGDLKSLNLLVDEFWTVKLADFGIAKADRIINNGQEDEENHGGTLQWLAPEYIISSPLYAKEMDIYALGVILWEIATRRKPWKGIKRSVICEAVLNGRRPEIFDSDNWSLGYKTLVDSCWHQNPKKRPSARVVRKRIENLVIP